MSGWTGNDLAGLALDGPLSLAESNAIRSTVENLTNTAAAPVRVRDLLDFTPAGARAAVIVGSPVEVADEMLAWVRETDVDGFNLVRVVMPETLESFVDLVVPELQSRGAFRTKYTPGTLREKLFPEGRATLPDNHPAAGFRRIRT